ncbi:MAG: hypothetical protein WA709_17720 [Stellaceae bacterium]
MKEPHPMSGGSARITLVNDLNRVYSPENIVETVARLQNVSRRADFLAINRELGVLGVMDEAAFRRYRRDLPIPRLIQQILTITHHAALFRQPPTPMHFEINVATDPSIDITGTGQLISITLNRPDPQPRAR